MAARPTLVEALHALELAATSPRLASNAARRPRRAGRARALLRAVLLAGAPLSCQPTGAGNPAPAPHAAPPSAGAPAPAPHAAPPSAGAPPPVERACSRDDECAVARVEVSGPGTCCFACGTTPGTRRWHADLQRYCAAHPPAACGPLACPQGPTRAVCRSGRCEATWTGPDGGPAAIDLEQRCLPAMICDAWKGCARVTGNAQDGWFVAEGELVPRGQPAVLGNACTAGARCEAARVVPLDVICPPWSVPPHITAPTYACVMEDGHCRANPR